MNNYRPESLEFYNGGVLSMQRGDLAGAIDNFSQALLREPTFIEAWENRAVARRHQGALDDALNDISMAIAHFPQRGSLYYNRALVLTDRRQLGDAINDYTAAIHFDSTNAHAYANRGNLFLQQGDISNAEIDLIQALNLNPQDTIALFHLSQIRLQKNDFIGAIADLTHIIHFEPMLERRVFALIYRASASATYGDLDNAIADMQQVIQSGIHPISLPELQQMLAQWQQLQQQSMRSIPTPPSGVPFATAMQEATAQSTDTLVNTTSLPDVSIQSHAKLPQTSADYIEQARSFLVSGNLEEALKCLNLALQLDNGNADAYAERGIVYNLLQQIDKGRKDLNHALVLAPNHVMALANLGVQEVQSGKLKNAFTLLQRAYDLNPMLAHTHYALGGYYEKQQKIPQAFAAYCRAVELDDTLAPAHNNKGRIYLMHGLLEQAMPNFLKTLELQPNNARALHNVGGVFLGQGRLADALPYFQSAAALGYDTAKKVLRELEKNAKFRTEGAQIVLPFEQALLVETSFEVARFAYRHCGPDALQKIVNKKWFFVFGERKVAKMEKRWAIAIENMTIVDNQGFAGKAPAVVLDLLEPNETIVYIMVDTDGMYTLQIVPSAKFLASDPNEVRKVAKNSLKFQRHELPMKLAELVQNNILAVRDHKFCYTGQTIQA